MNIEEFSFDLDEEQVENLKKAIGYDEIEARHKRFMNGIETTDDLINGILHYRIKNDDGLDLDVVEFKYYQKLIDLYEKEKEENKQWKKYATNDLEKQITERDNKIFELEAKLEKEKETSHYIQSQLDIVNAKLIEEKEKNKELSNSYDKLAKECNEENKRCMLLAVENQDLKEKNKKIEIIVNKLMPLAECSYWNYEKHTCTHTCRGCDDLNEDNKRTSSGILIDKDRYCRLYEDGYAEEDTKFVNVEDLIKRHLKEE